MRDARTLHVLPQVDFQTANFLIEAKEAIDRNRGSGVTTLIKRLLRDVRGFEIGTLPLSTQPPGAPNS
jgi:hypothetical protein